MSPELFAILIFTHVSSFSLGAVFGFKVLGWKLDSQTAGVIDLDDASGLEAEIEEELQNLEEEVE